MTKRNTSGSVTRHGVASLSSYTNMRTSDAGFVEDYNKLWPAVIVVKKGTDRSKVYFRYIYILSYTWLNIFMKFADNPTDLGIALQCEALMHVDTISIIQDLILQQELNP